MTEKMIPILVGINRGLSLSAFVKTELVPYLMTSMKVHRALKPGHDVQPQLIEL